MSVQHLLGVQVGDTVYRAELVAARLPLQRHRRAHVDQGRVVSVTPCGVWVEGFDGRSWFPLHTRRWSRIPEDALLRLVHRKAAWVRHATARMRRAQDALEDAMRAAADAGMSVPPLEELVGEAGPRCVGPFESIDW